MSVLTRTGHPQRSAADVEGGLPSAKIYLLEPCLQHTLQRLPSGMRQVQLRPSRRPSNFLGKASLYRHGRPASRLSPAGCLLHLAALQVGCMPCPVRYPHLATPTLRGICCCARPCRCLLSSAGTLPSCQWHTRAQLSSLPGGLGLCSAERYAPATYWISRADTCPW